MTTIYETLIELAYVLKAESRGYVPRTGEWVTLELPDALYSIFIATLPAEMRLVTPTEGPVRVADIVVTRMKP